MKKGIQILTLFLLFGVYTTKVKAQSYEVQCLTLDCTKLAQMKSMLSDMKKGYEVLTGGYDAIKDISEGNFHLHEVFLDNLMKVSPVVRKDKKIADIINDQVQIMKEYKIAWQQFSRDKSFSQEELKYIANVYKHLMAESLKELDDLTVVISPGVLRMSDDERLRRIDVLAGDMLDKLTFLRYFNNKTSVLSLQRLHEQNDISTSNNLYDLK